MALSAWLVGSITLPAQSLTVVQFATSEVVVLPAGTYFLESLDPALSLLRALETAIETHSSFAPGDVDARLMRNRRVYIESDQTMTLTWPGDSVLRNLLGFAGNLTPTAEEFSAPGVSPLLWSPGYLATPKTIEGVEGYTVPHQSIRKSADGTQVHCDHYSTETWQDLEWTHIIPERMRVATGTGGGTFHEFFEQCAMLRRRFLWYPEVDESDASSTIASLPAPFGPYVLRDGFDGDWYRRNVPFAEVSSPLEIPMHRVAELT